MSFAPTSPVRGQCVQHVGNAFCPCPSFTAFTLYRDESQRYTLHQVHKLHGLASYIPAHRFLARAALRLRTRNPCSCRLHLPRSPPLPSQLLRSLHSKGISSTPTLRETLIQYVQSRRLKRRSARAGHSSWIMCRFLIPIVHPLPMFQSLLWAMTMALARPLTRRTRPPPPMKRTPCYTPPLLPR